MGIRIKTAIGYGVKLSAESVNFLRNELYHTETMLEISQKIIADVREYAQSTDKIWFREKAQEKDPFNVKDYILFDEEFLFPDRAILLPHPFGKHWMRNDDNIDYFQAGIFPELGDMTDIVWRETKRGIYPYLGLMKANPDKPLGIETYMESCYMDKPHEHLIPYAPEQLMFYMKHLFGIPEERRVEEHLKLTPVYARWWS
jgi:hypothetical protein